MKTIRKIFKFIAPKSFNDGLARCNDLGKKLISRKGIERFLDVGCGDGRLTIEFAKIANPKKMYGLEFIDEF